jgi:hypothetical protein
MSLESSISIKDEDEVSHIFSEVSRDNTRSVRIESTTDIIAPWYMTISQVAQRTKSGPLTDRTLVQYALTKLDANSAPQTALVNTTFVVPRLALFSVNDFKLLATLGYNFLSRDAGNDTTWANLSAILRGEK